MIVLIPSYEPDTRLVTAVRELRAAAPECAVVVVDDGSGPAYAAVFAAARRAGAEIISSPVNSGKGRALKTGFAYLREHFPEEDVVCADSDGQHATADILRVAGRLSDDRWTIVLGSRRFTGAVPLRSRLGNTVATAGFRFASGLSLGDTQTGLRGYPPHALEWLETVRGERFEYELNTLLGATAAGYRIDEVEIETIYLERNATSHFRPVVDSVRVLLPLLAFAFASFASFLVDTVALLVINALTGSLLFSVVGARVISGGANFLLNRQVVFKARGRRTLVRDAVRYVALALAILAASYLSLAALTGLGLPLLAAKIVADTTLYLVSYHVQRRFVFPRRPDLRAINHEHATAPSGRTALR